MSKPLALGVCFLLGASLLFGPSVEPMLQQGQELLRQNRLDEALERFRAAVRLGDASGAGRYGEALVWLARKEYERALPHLQAAVAAGPADSGLLFTLLATELELKQVAQAREHIAALTRLKPRDAWIRYRLGALLLEKGLLPDAEREFQAAAQLLAATDPNLSDTLLQLAQLRFARFDYAAALDYLRRIRLDALAPASQAAVLHLEGYGLLAGGRIAEARDRFRRAVDSDPSRPDYTIRLIWTQLLRGQTEEARRLAAAARARWPQAAEVQQAFALAERERASSRAEVPYTTDWRLKGEGIVSCPCRVPCPCRSNAPPTHGHCENTGVFRITEGHYGAVPLNGVTFATTGCTMGPQTLPSVLYVDQSALDSQLVALEKLYQGFVPVRPMVFANVKRVALSFLHSAADRSYEARIPGVLEMKVRRRLPGASTAAVDYLANVIEYADNLVYRVDDREMGLSWDYSGLQSNYRCYDLHSRDYQDGRMLVQYVDGSGSFNTRQRELIRSLKLPVAPPARKAAKKR